VDEKNKFEIKMGKEINLLLNYPKSKRNTKERGFQKTEEDRIIARKFSKDFFDGDRKHGYGGFKYNPKFWRPVIPTFIEYWNLNSNSSLLDVGCAKGFMLYDFQQIIPGIKLNGIDISDYAVKHSIPEVSKLIQVADAKELPFADNSFDAVISINTIHNLPIADCAKALKEISRVSRKNAFVTVDAYNNEEEKRKMYDWNLTAKTIMSVNEWKIFFKESGYNGDYFWFIP